MFSIEKMFSVFSNLTSVGLIYEWAPVVVALLLLIWFFEVNPWLMVINTWFIQSSGNYFLEVLAVFRTVSGSAFPAGSTNQLEHQVNFFQKLFQSLAGATERAPSPKDRWWDHGIVNSPWSDRVRGLAIGETEAQKCNLGQGHAAL